MARGAARRVPLHPEERPLPWAARREARLLNPGPYLFGFTVGGSHLIRGSATESTVFVVTAIGALIASEVAVAVLAARFFPSPESRGYLVTMRFLGGALA